MQYQNPNTNFNFDDKNIQITRGFHSPQQSEPISPLRNDSSSFHFSDQEYYGTGATYGNYQYRNIATNPNYSDDSIYGPGYDNPLSSFYGFRPLNILTK